MEKCNSPSKSHTSLKVSLWNRLDFTNLDDAVTVTYEIKEEGRLLSQGSVAVPSIEPHEKGFVLIPETPKTNKNTYLKLTYTAKQGTALAGEVLGFDQIALFEEHLYLRLRCRHLLHGVYMRRRISMS